MPRKGQKMNPESRKKIAEALTGRKQPRELVEKIAASNRGKKRSPEAIANLINGRKGVRFSEEAKKILSESHKGLPMPEKTLEAVVKNKNYRGRKVIINGIPYNNMKAASRALGINYQDIVIACRYRPERAKEYGITIDWVEPKGDEM